MKVEGKEQFPEQIYKWNTEEMGGSDWDLLIFSANVYEHHAKGLKK